MLRGRWMIVVYLTLLLACLALEATLLWPRQEPKINSSVDQYEPNDTGWYAD